MTSKKITNYQHITNYVWWLYLRLVHQYNLLSSNNVGSNRKHAT